MAKKYLLKKQLKEASSPGSLTVEAALVLPIFLFAMLSVMYLIEAVRFSSEMSAALAETSTEYAKYAYVCESLTRADDNSGAGLLQLLGGKALGVTAAKAQVISWLGKEYVERAPIEGGEAGISFLRSTVLGSDDMIDIRSIWSHPIRYIPPLTFWERRGRT